MGAMPPQRRWLVLFDLFCAAAPGTTGPTRGPQMEDLPVGGACHGQAPVFQTQQAAEPEGQQAQVRPSEEASGAVSRQTHLF